MKRYLPFVAALGMCFFASIAAAYAQVRADTGPVTMPYSVDWTGAFYSIAHHGSYSYARDAREGHRGWPFGAQAPGPDDRTRVGASFCNRPLTGAAAGARGEFVPGTFAIIQQIRSSFAICSL